MNFGLDGHTALVCGASQGIGQACAFALAAQGARVVLLARDHEALEKVRAQLPSPSLHRTLAVDVLDLRTLKQKVASTIQELGPISILVCNSGGPAGGKLLDADDEVFLKAFTQHVIANQCLVRLLVPGMREKNFGRIINIISTSVKAPIPNLGVSNTIRGAVASWAKTLSFELAAWGITVNNVLPGYTQTSRLEILIEASAKQSAKSVSEIKEDWRHKIPVGRFGSPEEISAAVAFLASPAASYVNGINLPVDGGRTPSL